MKRNLVLALTSALCAQSALAAGNYPTLEKLCDAAKSKGQSGLSIAGVVISPYELWTVSMECDYGVDYLGSTHTFQGVYLKAVHSVASGASMYSEDVRGFGRLQQATTNGKPELDLVFTSEHDKIVVRDFLRLNAQGQPVNTVDHFDATLDPSEVALAGQNASDYVSGTYVEQDAVSAVKGCVELAHDANDVKDCSAITDSQKFAASIGSRNWNPIADDLGWLATGYPTNTHLDQDATRVDFQAALKELATAINNGNVSDQDFAAALKSAKDALASGDTN